MNSKNVMRSGGGTPRDYIPLLNGLHYCMETFPSSTSSDRKQSLEWGCFSPDFLSIDILGSNRIRSDGQVIPTVFFLKVRLNKGINDLSFAGGGCSNDLTAPYSRRYEQE